MISPELEKTLRTLRRLAKTQTQADAAELLGVTRQRVHTLARTYGVTFRKQAPTSKLRTCGRCNYTKNGSKVCLRCKWTPRRIRQLRKRYGLSQVKMSYEILGMNVWAVTRWENGRLRPSRSSLEKLELAEKA